MESCFQSMEILDWRISQTDGFPVPDQPFSIPDETPSPSSSLSPSSDLNASGSFGATDVPVRSGSVLRADDRRSLRLQFEQDLLDYAQQIEAAISEERFDDLRRLAHRLKGSSSMYGYQSVMQAALAVEDTFRHAKVPLGLKARLRIVETAYKLSSCCLDRTIK